MIRTASLSDMESLVYLGAIDGHADEAWFGRCFEEMDAGRIHVFLSEESRKVDGYVILNFQPRYQLFCKMDIPEIQDLYVHPCKRRQGKGAALIDACETAAGKAGASHLGIGVAVHKGSGPAQRLYVQKGYVPDGYGAVYNRETVAPGSFYAVDDSLCLMMVKALS